MAQKQSKLVSISPEILELRKEFKKKYGSTDIFDYFYTGLCQKVGKSWLRSMERWAKSGGSIIRRHNGK